MSLFDFGKALAAFDVTYQLRFHLLGSTAGDHESLVLSRLSQEFCLTTLTTNIHQ